jgi:hypothetical protein
MLKALASFPSIDRKEGREAGREGGKRNSYSYGRVGIM